MPKRKILFLIADIALIALSVFLAFWVRFEGQIPPRYFLDIEGIILLSSLFTIPIFYFLKLYSFTWLYVSTTELVSLMKSVILSFLILSASFIILKDHPVFEGFPRSTLFISYFFIFVLCGGTRFAKRIYLQVFSKNKGKERTLIAGAGRAGEQILRSILSSPDSPYLPVGFVDDNPEKNGIMIHGLKVLGKISDIPQIAKKEKVEGLIVAFPSAGSKNIREAVGKGREAGFRKIKIIPSMEEVINGKVGLGVLKEVEMEDLLGRESHFLDKKLIESLIQGKKVLITGAAGSIGSELCRQIAQFNPSMILVLDQDETGIFNISGELKDNFPKLNIKSVVADVREEIRINQIFSSFAPNLVFHAAAYKHVPLMEEQPSEAIKNNIFGTKIVAENSTKCGAEKFIFISTDKAVEPASVMGATKRAGEMICQIENQTSGGRTRFISVRFGNVLGSRGSVIPIFKEKIKKRESIEITHPDMKRFFMTTPEACVLVLQAAAMGQGGEVFVLDMGDPIKILDLARELIRLSGLEPDKDIPIVYSAPRPGEKFSEEILTAEEGTTTTQNQKIFIAKQSAVSEERFNSFLEKLKEVIDVSDKKVITADSVYQVRSAIIDSLKEVIPSYHQK